MGIFDFIKKKDSVKKTEQSQALSLNKRSAPRQKHGAEGDVADQPEVQSPKAKPQSVVTAPIHPIRQHKQRPPAEAKPAELHLTKQGPTESLNFENIPKVQKLSIDDIDREKLNLKSQQLSKGSLEEDNNNHCIEPSELDKTQDNSELALDLTEANPLKAPMLGEAPKTERKELKINQVASLKLGETPKAERKELKINHAAQNSPVKNSSAYSSNAQIDQDIQFIEDKLNIPFQKMTCSEEGLFKEESLSELSHLSLSLDKNRIMPLLSLGEFKLSLTELVELLPSNPFKAGLDQNIAFELPLTEIMSLIPPEWFVLETVQDSKALESISDIDNPFNFEGQEDEIIPEEHKKRSSSTNLLAADNKEEDDEEDAPVLNITEDDEEDAPVLNITEDDEEDAPVLNITEEEDAPVLNITEDDEEDAPASKSFSLFDDAPQSKNVLKKEKSASLFADKPVNKVKSQSLFASEDSLFTANSPRTTEKKAVKLSPSLELPTEVEKKPSTPKASPPKENPVKKQDLVIPEQQTGSDAVLVDLNIFLDDFKNANLSEVEELYKLNKIQFKQNDLAPKLMSGRVAFSVSEINSMTQPSISIDDTKSAQEVELSLATLLNHVPMTWMTMTGQAEDHLAAINDIDDPFASDEDGNFSSSTKPEEKKTSSHKGLNLLSGDISETVESRPSSPSKDELIRNELNRDLKDDTINLQFAAPETLNEAPKESPVLQEKKKPTKLFAETRSLQKEEKKEKTQPVNALDETVDDTTLAEPENAKALSQSGLIIEDEAVTEKATPSRKERTASFVKSDKIGRPSSAPNGVDLNRCTLDEILDISYDLEESVAEAILALRKEKGSFHELREILEIEEISTHDFKLLTGMSPSDNLIESERKLNRLLKLDRRKDYSIAQLIDTAQEELDFKSIVLSSKDGLQITSAGDSDLFETNSELLASISPQLFKKTKSFIEQSMLPQPDLFTFYTKDTPVTFAPAGEIAIVFIHDSPWPTPSQMAKARNLVADLSWYCSRRLVL